MPPATRWPASLFLVELGDVEAPVAVPEPLDEEEDPEALPEEEEEEEEVGTVVVDAIGWWRGG